MLPPIGLGPGVARSAIREWSDYMAQFKEVGQQLYYMLGRPDAIFAVNGLADLIAEAQPTDELSDSAGQVGITAMGAAAARALTTAWQEWMQTPILVGQDGNGDPIMLTPVAIISRR